MGLEGVELVMALEDAFEIAISDEDAASLRTPGNVVIYILGRLQSGNASVCLQQRAFYRLRRAAMQVFELDRREVVPSTSWESILPERRRRRNWRLLGNAAGVTHWPQLSLVGRFRPAFATVAGTSRFLADHAPACLIGEGEEWTQATVETVVARLVRECLCIDTFEWDQDFVRDLGLG